MFVVIFSGSVSFSWMHMYVLSCFEDNLSLFHLDSGLMLYLYSSTFCLVLQKNSGRKMLAIILFEQLMQKWRRCWNLLKASVLMKSTVLYTVPGSSSLFGVAVLKKFGVKLHEIRTLTWRISIFDPLSQFVFTQEKDVNVLRFCFGGSENIWSVISFLTLCSALRDQGRGTGRNGRGLVRRESWKSPQTVAGSACRSRSARPQSSSASRCLASCCRRRTPTCQARPCCPCCCLARPCLVARTDLRQGSLPPCQEAPGSKCSSRRVIKTKLKLKKKKFSWNVATNSQPWVFEGFQGRCRRQEPHWQVSDCAVGEGNQLRSCKHLVEEDPSFCKKIKLPVYEG